jgi:hypothetical protein
LRHRCAGKASISDASFGRNRLAVNDTTTAKRTEAATSTASTVFDNDAATYAPTTIPGTRPTSAIPTPRRSMWARSAHATAKVIGRMQIRIAAGMNSGSTNARTGDAIIPTPMPIDACTVAPTYTASMQATAAPIDRPSISDP